MKILASHTSDRSGAESRVASKFSVNPFLYLSQAKATIKKEDYRCGISFVDLPFVRLLCGDVESDLDEHGHCVENLFVRVALAFILVL